jgi:hypothetical protein
MRSAASSELMQLHRLEPGGSSRQKARDANVENELRSMTFWRGR